MEKQIIAAFEERTNVFTRDEVENFAFGKYTVIPLMYRHLEMKNVLVILLKKRNYPKYLTQDGILPKHHEKL